MIKKKHLFSPQSLKTEKVYSASVLFEVPEEEKAKLEFSSLHSVQKFALLDLLKAPQNRYWLYQDSPFSFSRSYAFRLKSFDQQAKSLSFSPPKQKLLSNSSVKQIYSLKDEISLQKGRMISAFSKGWKLSVNGDLRKIRYKKKKNFIGRIFFKKVFLKKKERKNREKKSQAMILDKKNVLFFSISSYGYITNLRKFSKVSFLKKRSKKKNKFRSYFKFLSSFRNSVQVIPSYSFKKKKKEILKNLI